MRSIARSIAALCTYRCGRHVCTLMLIRGASSAGFAVEGWPRSRRRHWAAALSRSRESPRDNLRSGVSPSGIVDQGERLDIVNNRTEPRDAAPTRTKVARPANSLAWTRPAAIGGAREARARRLAALNSRAHSERTPFAHQGR